MTATTRRHYATRKKPRDAGIAVARARVAEATGEAVPVHIRQVETDLLFADVEWVSPGLIRVRHGEKQVRRGTEVLAARPGELLFLPAGSRVDVRSVPDQGVYEADGVILSTDLARLLPPPAAERGPQRVLTLRVAEHAELDAALTRCVEALDRNMPAAVRRSRLAELVAWLEDAGIHPFAAASDLRLRLKRLLGEQPARAWRLADVSRHLGMSEDTLQRQLRRAGSGFQPLLQEVRMEHALMLLWTTERPLGLVAEESGYDSPSRFAERFRERFGLLPSELRRRR